MIRKVKFIDMPELKLPVNSPELDNYLQQRYGDQLDQVSIFISPSDGIALEFSDCTRLVFHDNTYQGIEVDIKLIGICIFSTNIREFIEEQLSNDSDTLLIPKLV